MAGRPSWSVSGTFARITAFPRPDPAPPGPASGGSTATTGSLTGSQTSTSPTGSTKTITSSTWTTTPTTTTSPTTSPTRPCRWCARCVVATPPSRGCSTSPTGPCTPPSRPGRPTWPSTGAATTLAGTRSATSGSPDRSRWGWSRPTRCCRPATPNPTTRRVPGTNSLPTSRPPSPATRRCTPAWSTTLTRTSAVCGLSWRPSASGGTRWSSSPPTTGLAGRVGPTAPQPTSAP